MEQIMYDAREKGCFLEVNSYPDRLDLNGDYCRMAKKIGCMLSIDTDSHCTRDLDNMRYGIGQARRGWIEPDNVLNTRTYDGVIGLLRR
jgi:DNA polymerase (family 10)